MLTRRSRHHAEKAYTIYHALYNAPAESSLMQQRNVATTSLAHLKALSDQAINIRNRAERDDVELCKSIVTRDRGSGVPAQGEEFEMVSESIAAVSRREESTSRLETRLFDAGEWNVVIVDSTPGLKDCQTQIETDDDDEDLGDWTVL
jgi:hypothetical protein